jgi:K+-transporting ATPase KdpF subunit
LWTFLSRALCEINAEKRRLLSGVDAQRRGSEGEFMAFIIAGILAILLLAYLVYAMFNPEKFQ